MSTTSGPCTISPAWRIWARCWRRARRGRLPEGRMSSGDVALRVQVVHLPGCRSADSDGKRTMVSRRQFCEQAGCAAAGLGGFGPALLTGAAADARTLDDVRERLMAALPSRRHAASIGKARLAALGERGRSARAGQKDRRRPAPVTRGLPPMPARRSESGAQGGHRLGLRRQSNHAARRLDFRRDREMDLFSLAALAPA